MWLFFQDPPDEFGTGGVNVKGTFTSLKEAAKKNLPDTQLKVLTQIEDKVKDLQKTMSSGLVLGGEAFREKVEEIYIETTELGIQFKDVTDLMGGMSKSVGRIIDPSKLVVQEMAVLGKNVGIASEAMGTLIGDFMNLTFSQEKSAQLITKITENARKAGVNVKSTLESVQKNLDKVNAYGFKNGVDGLAKMTVQAQQLRTTVEEIGAVQMGQTFWDPEKAIEAAAGMSMLGGSMSNLMNPFQLMNMGANNVEKLQESLIDLSASAYKVNETTGEVETNFVAQQRLKQQLEALGKTGEYEKYINLGKEAAKQAKIIADINKSGLGELFGGEGKTFSEEEQRLIASLSEVGKDGKISLNIPGFDNIDNLQEALTGNPDRIKDALQKYQDAASQSEKDIAVKSLSTVDNIKNDTTVISQILLRSLTAQERTEVLQKTETVLGGQVERFKQDAIITANMAKNIILNPSNLPEEDAFFSGGKKKLSLSKGEVFNFIDEDQALFAPNIDKNMGILKNSFLQMKKLLPTLDADINTEINMPTLKTVNPFELMNNTPNRLENITTTTTTKEEKKESKETVQKIEGSGTININVNISSSGDLASSLMSDRRFRNDLETEILNTMKNKDLLMVQKP